MNRSPVSPDILARHGSGRFVGLYRIHHAESRATSHACQKRIWALPRHLKQDLCVHSLLCFCSAVSASIHISLGLPSCHTIREKKVGDRSERKENRDICMPACYTSVLLIGARCYLWKCSVQEHGHCCNLSFYQFEDPETQTGHARTVTRKCKLQFASGVVHPDLYRSH